MNPALTLSLLATRRLDVLRAFTYITAQCLGASLGAGALYLALPSKNTAEYFVNKVCSPILFDHIKDAASFLNIPVSRPTCAAPPLTPTLCHSGAHRAERRSGSRHRGFVHLPDGLHCVLS